MLVLFIMNKSDLIACLAVLVNPDVFQSRQSFTISENGSTRMF
jgi:hypothetical protein